MDCVTLRARGHDIVFRVIHDCKVEEIQLVVACLFEDFAPMSPLVRSGISDVVMDKIL